MQIPSDVMVLLSFVWAVHIVSLVIWIVIQKRQPVSTITWILSLSFLPVIGFFIYYLIGPQKLKRNRLKRVRSKSGFIAQQDMEHFKRFVPDVPLKIKQLVNLIARTTSYPVSTATGYKFFSDGANTYDDMIASINRATDHVHMEYYIYDPDETGTLIRDALIQKAKEGIRVRVLLDALGSFYANQAYFKDLTDAGGEVHYFHESRFGRRLRPVINMRTHRKILICDGKIGYTGGINITDTENERVRPDAFHDSHICLQGSAVNWLQMVFLEDWLYVTGKNVPGKSSVNQFFPDFEPGPYPVQIHPSGPDTEWESIHIAIVAAINAAEERVWLTTPYFIPTEEALMAIIAAILRGVDVQILVPKKGDSFIVTAASRSYFDELIIAGAKVWEFQERMLHSKTIVIDNWLGIIGTANFDSRSFRLNFEVSVFAYGDWLCEKLAAQFQKDLKNSQLVEKNRKLPPWQVLGDSVARLMSPLL